MNNTAFLLLSAVFFVSSNCSLERSHMAEESKKKDYKYPVEKTEQQWQKELNEDEYYVLRQKGTERPFTGVYNNFKKEGTYLCAACGAELFSSDTKFDSGSGWPSFYRPLSEKSVEEHRDYSHGMIRTEIVCARCGGHLGHVFNDGPKPTGQRYCINSVSLDFKPDEE